MENNFLVKFGETWFTVNRITRRANILHTIFYEFLIQEDRDTNYFYDLNRCNKLFQDPVSSKNQKERENHFVKFRHSIYREILNYKKKKNQVIQLPFLKMVYICNKLMESIKCADLFPKPEEFTQFTLLYCLNQIKQLIFLATSSVDVETDQKLEAKIKLETQFCSLLDDIKSREINWSIYSCCQDENIYSQFFSFEKTIGEQLTKTTNLLPDLIKIITSYLFMNGEDIFDHLISINK